MPLCGDIHAKSLRTSTLIGEMLGCAEAPVVRDLWHLRSNLARLGVTGVRPPCCVPYFSAFDTFLCEVMRASPLRLVYRRVSSPFTAELHTGRRS